MGKEQIIIRTEMGDTDLFYYLEQLEKRLASLEEQVRSLIYAIGELQKEEKLIG